MTPKWPIGTLRDAIGNKGYIRGPFGSALRRAELKSAGVPVYEQQHAITGTREFRYYVDDERYNALKRFAVQPHDLIISCSGTLARVSMIRPEDPHGIISQALLILRPDTAVVWPKYLYYFMSSKQGYDSLVGVSTGSVQVNIARRSIIQQTEMPLPPLSQQRAIAHILGVIDDKIELNRRMNETLEAMARALFKSWFVDFDPVRAKAEGRDPGLPKHLADLFPSRLVPSELGEIPESWEIGVFGEYASNFDSKRVPVSGRERANRSGRFPYHGAAGVMDYVDDYIFDGIYLLIGEDGSVMRDSGLGVKQYVWGKLWVNNHAHVLQGKGAVSTEHLYLYFDFEPVEPYVTGAVQPKLSQGRMNRMPFLFAGDEICTCFYDVVKPLFASLRSRTDESRNLAALRDTLLPKLISGEIRVKDAQRFMETAEIAE